MSALLDAALAYASIGWHVFPIADKEPLTRNGHLNATTDADQIRTWWTASPDAQIGVHVRASGLLVIDVDGERGRAKLAEVERELGPLPRDLVQRSKHGEHIVLADPSPGPDGWTRPNAGTIRGNIGGQGVIDIKCNGYIVVEPSPNYQWLADGDPENPPSVPDSWTPLLQHVAPAERVDLPPPTGELAERIERGRRALQDASTPLLNFTPTDRHEMLRAVLSGERLPGPVKTGDAKINRVGITIGKVAPDIGDDAAWAIARPSVVATGASHSLARLEARFRDGFTFAAGQEYAKQAPNEPAARGRLMGIDDVIGDIRRRAALPVVMTPWPNFDRATGGLEVGSVTIAVGYQGSGKSSFAAQLGAHHADTGPVIYYLGEMTHGLLGARVIGQRTKRSWRDVLRGKLTDQEMRTAWPRGLKILPRSSDPIGAITAAIAEVRAAGAAGTIMLVVDYLQLLASLTLEMRAGNADVARRILSLTEDEGLVTIALSQTSRGNSKRIREGAEDSIDLADTGAESSELERSATVQLALSYQQKDDQRVHDVIAAIGKRRFGGPTKLYFRYDGETGVWSESTEVIRPQAEVKIDTAILEQMTIHEDRCTCGRKMSATTLATANTAHKVTGGKESILASLKRLETAKKVRRSGNEYLIVGGLHDKPVQEAQADPNAVATPYVVRLAK